MCIISFYCWIPLHCLDIPHFIYPFSWWNLGCFHFLAMSNGSMNIHVWVLCEQMFSFLFGIYLGVEMLGHVVTICLTFWGTARLSSKAGVSFNIPISSVWGFLFPHMHINIYYVFLIMAILVGMKWDLAVVLICISLMANDIEYLFMFLLAICITSLEKCLFRSFAQLLFVFFKFN